MAKRRYYDKNRKRNSNKNVVVQKLVVQQPQRKTQDIENWRNAIRQAESIENPNRTQLYDLYEDIMLDSHVKSCVNKRVKPVKNSRIVFKRNGKKDENITELCGKEWFRRMIKEIVKAKLWGYTVCELWIDGGEVKYKLVPRKHVVPEKEKIITHQSNTYDDGYCYKEPPYRNHMVWCGEDNDLGELLGICQYVIYKRGGFGDWSTFAEIFGSPFRIGKYKNYDDATRVQLEQAMAEAGNASFLVVPETAQIEVLANNNASGNTTLHSELRKACNEEILIGLLGQTMTTENGSSHSQSKVHKSEQDEITADDMLFTENVLNERFKEILPTLGYNADGGEFEIVRETTLSVKEQVEILNMVKTQGGVPIDDDTYYETARIPKPKNYEKLKKEKEQAKEKEQQEEKKQKGQGQKKLSETEEYKLAETNFWNRLKSFFDRAPY